MYYHNCGKPIYSTRIIEIKSGFSITSNGVIQTGKAKLGGYTKAFSIQCESCGEVKDNREIISRCMGCGENFSVDNLYTLSSVGGVYCENCQKSCYPEHCKYNLSTIINKTPKE